MFHYLWKLIYEFERTNLDDKTEDNLAKIFNSVSINSSSNNDNQIYFGKPSRYKNINTSSFKINN